MGCTNSKRQASSNSNTQNDLTKIDFKIEKVKLEGESNQKYFTLFGNRYDILDFLGQGHFSEVYKVMRLHDQKEFAVKVLKQAESKKEFLNEYNILKQFNSEYITKLEGMLELDGKYSFIIEYANQNTLEQFINSLKFQKQLIAFHQLDFISNIFQGLEALHSKNIIHRDLKLDNLLVHNYKVKISDLGVSTELKNSYAKTQVGNLFNQPLENLTKYKEPADIFAAGIIACQILFNPPPLKLFQMKHDNKIEEIMNAPEELKNYLLKITNKDPKQRYTAGESFQISQQLKYNNNAIEYIEGFAKEMNSDNPQTSYRSKVISEQKTTDKANATSTTINSLPQIDNFENSLFEIGMNQIKLQQYKEALITFKQIQQITPQSEKAKIGLNQLQLLDPLSSCLNEKQNQLPVNQKTVNHTSYISNLKQNTNNPQSKYIKDAENIPELTCPAKNILEKLGTYIYNCPQFDDVEATELGPKQFKNNSVYIGQWKNGQRSGRGKQIWQDGSIYEGYWRNNKGNGHGRLIHSDGDVYEGGFENDKAQGEGTYTRSNGDLSLGEWKLDQKDGYSIETYFDGSKYVGNYVKGQKNGNGFFLWADGSTYEGQLQNNFIHGRGTYHWPDGRKYDGEWQYNKMHGTGTFIWPDGRNYKGQWKDDKQHGVGLYTNIKGEVKKREWQEGKRIK